MITRLVETSNAGSMPRACSTGWIATPRRYTSNAIIDNCYHRVTRARIFLTTAMNKCRSGKMPADSTAVMRAGVATGL
jgi:hypothetical protein